jgi:hypothetical protein
VNEGETAEFKCTFSSNPTATKFVWFKNGTEELVASELMTFESTGSTCTCTFRVPNCVLGDSGTTYSVKVFNELGDCVSNKATLGVSAGPAFVTGPADLSVPKDKEARFECIVQSNPKPTVAWSLNGKELTTKDGVRIEKDLPNDKYTLVIPRVALTHIGTVSVKATNEMGSSERSCQLDVLEPPKVLNKLDNQTVNETEPASFTVKFNGKPKPQVKWFKDDKEIGEPSIDVYEIVETEDSVTLVIKSTKPEDAGNYSAQLTNEAGQVVSNKAQLTVKC